MDAEQWDARYAATPELQWGAEPNRWVAREMAELPAGRALDVGAGEGRNAVWLARRGWTVTAVDFSGAALDKGRRLAAAHRADVEWVQADVRTYEPAAAGYDAVLLIYLQLVADQRRAVTRRAVTALAPGATLLVVAHDSTNLTDGVGGPPDPSVLFTPDDVVADLTGLAGLRVERAERVLRPVTTDQGTRHAIDALVRVSRR